MRTLRATIRTLALAALGVRVEPPPPETHRVRCYHCGGWFPVAGLAITASCPNCARQVMVKDLTIDRHHWGGALQTCGRIHIQPHGRIQSNLAIASVSAMIEGRLDAMLICGGPVWIGPRAVVHGGIRCPKLTIEPGARLIGGPFQVPIDPLGSFDVLEAGRCRPGRGPAAQIESKPTARQSPLVLGPPLFPNQPQPPPPLRQSPQTLIRPLASSKPDPKVSDGGCMRRGFSLIELVIVVVIIGIIGAIAVPRLSSFTEKSQNSRMIADLHALQDAGDRYAAEHWGRVAAQQPDGDGETDPRAIIKRLVLKTNENGAFSGTQIYGPYLRKWPTNIANNKRTLRIDGPVAGANTHGWRYDSDVGIFEADHSNARIISDLADIATFTSGMQAPIDIGG